MIFKASYPFFIHDYFVLQQQQGQVKNLDIMELGAKDFYGHQLLISILIFTKHIIVTLNKCMHRQEG